MPLPSLASITDFQDWESRTVDNEARAEAILAAASTLIRARTGRLWVGADGETEDDVTEVQRETVRHVTLTVTSRVYNNPNGLTQETEGPFSRSVADWAALGLVLTDEEKVQLVGAPIPATGIPGLGSVRVVAPIAAAGVPRGEPWWDDEDSEVGEGDGS